MSSTKTIGMSLSDIILGSFLLIVVLGIIGYVYSQFGAAPSPTGRIVEEEAPEEKVECVPNWQCTSWSECGSDGKQTRTCSDLNNCGTISGKPAETQSCTPPKPKYFTIGDTITKNKIGVKLVRCSMTKYGGSFGANSWNTLWV
jgi:uncharacterized Zn-binding protein involved in type VI secretion